MSQLIAAFRRLIARGVPGRAVLAACLLALAWAGSGGAWISFPMTEGAAGPEMVWPWSIPFAVSSLPMSTFLLSLLALACALFFVSARFALGVMGLVLGGMLSVPFAAGTSKPHWIGTYVTESLERAELEAFVRRYFGSNVTSEPTYLPLTRLDGASDQIVAGWAMLGSGWMLSTVAALLLAALMVRRGKALGDLSVAAAVTVVFLAVLIGGPVHRVLDAQARVAEGDSRMLEGRADEARRAYAAALERNPSLVHAVPFLMRSAETWSRDGGSGGAPYRMRSAWLASSRRPRSGGAELVTLRSHREDLIGLLESRAGKEPLELALHRWARALNGWLWMREGLSLMEDDAFAPAALAFERAERWAPSLVAPFFQAKTYMALGDGAKAVRALQPLKSRIAHDSLLADVHCAIGDAHTGMSELAEARGAYRKCRELDQKDNFWVLRALSGT